MPEQVTIAANAPEGAQGTAPAEVSTPETPNPAAPEAIAPQAKVEEGAPAEGTEVKPPVPQEEKETPYHLRPEFRIQARVNKRLETSVRAQSQTISKLETMLGELLAHQKGEEYKPNETPVQIDPEIQFDSDLEAISAAEKLTPQDEEAIEAIARKHAMKEGDKVLPMPANLAYEIYKEYVKKASEAPKSEVVPAAPATPVQPAPENPQPVAPVAAATPPLSLAEAAARARARLRAA